MYLLYADESGSTGLDYTNEQQPIFILGGFIVNDKDWFKINAKFNEIKTLINPLFEKHEIHTNEIFNSSKKSIFYRYDWKENLKMLEQIAAAICELDIEFFHIGINKPKYKKYIESITTITLEELPHDPYLISYMHLYGNISSYLHNSKSENGLIFLDEFLPLTNVLENFSSLVIDFKDYYRNNIIENALFLKSKSSNFIQIADFYSFYMNKFYSITKGYKKYGIEKQNHCLTIASRLLNKTNLSYSNIIE